MEGSTLFNVITIVILTPRMQGKGTRYGAWVIPVLPAWHASA